MRIVTESRFVDQLQPASSNCESSKGGPTKSRESFPTLNFLETETSSENPNILSEFVLLSTFGGSQKKTVAMHLPWRFRTLQPNFCWAKKMVD